MVRLRSRSEPLARYQHLGELCVRTIRSAIPPHRNALLPYLYGGAFD